MLTKREFLALQYYSSGLMGKFTAFFLAVFLRIIACPTKFVLFFLSRLLHLVCDLMRFAVFFSTLPPTHQVRPACLGRNWEGLLSKVRDQQSSSSNYGFLFRPLCQFFRSQSEKSSSEIRSSSYGFLFRPLCEFCCAKKDEKLTL
jgi:hypothetical protein